MKKLFVSVPMRGRTEEEIKASIDKMWNLAEIFEGEELELIDSYIDEECPAGVNAGVWYLGKSLELLAQADVFIGVGVWDDFPGCRIENEVADMYGIKRYITDPAYIIEDYQDYVNRLFTAKPSKCEVPANE